MHSVLHAPILVVINFDGTEYFLIQKHRIYDMRQIQGSIVLEFVIVATELASILKAIASSAEEMAYNTLFDDIGNIEHVIYSNIAFVLRVNNW